MAAHAHPHLNSAFIVCLALVLLFF